jgi:hypothetical protein
MNSGAGDNDELGLSRAAQFTEIYRDLLEKEIFDEVHGAMTQEVGHLFILSGVSAQFCEHVFPRLVRRPADLAILPDFSIPMGRRVVCHDDWVSSESLSRDDALSTMLAGNNMVYVIDLEEKLPSWMPDKATKVIRPQFDPFALAVAALRRFYAKVGAEIRLLDMSRRETSNLDALFDGAALRGTATVSVNLPTVLAPEVFFLFRDCARRGLFSAPVLALCARWRRNPAWSPSQPIKDDGTIPSLADFPGLGTVRTRIASILSRHAAGLGDRSGILLHGPTGTGKTMLARTIAFETRRHLIAASAGTWLAAGDGSHVMRAMTHTFEEARATAPSLLFIDELDSFPNRSRNENSPYWTGIINHLLALIHGFNDRGDVLLVAATNNKLSIDPALLRPGRFGDHVLLDHPGLPARGEIVEWHARQCAGKTGISPAFDFDEAASLIGGLSPAMVAAVVQSSAHAATMAGEPMTIRHVEEAVLERQGGIGTRHAEADRLTTAVHEAGHAIALHLLGDGTAIERVSIRSQVGTLGRVTAAESWVLARTTVRRDVARGVFAMAGRVAEMLVFGFEGMSYGSLSDIESGRRYGSDLAKEGITPEGIDVLIDPENRKVLAESASNWAAFFNRCCVEILSPYVAAISSFAALLTMKEEVFGKEAHSFFNEVGVPTNIAIPFPAAELGK